MRSSTILALLGASLAVATPLAHNHLHNKKAIEYDIITDIVYVTITEDPQSTTSSSPAPTVKIVKTVYVNPEEPTHSKKPTPTYVPPPPPPTSTSAPPPPPPPTTYAPAPAPATQAAPAVEVPSKAPAPAPAPAPPASSPPASSSDGSFAGIGVDNHNSCRSQHQAGNVAWNETLVSVSQQIASSCKWGEVMNINGGGYGQNIAAVASSSSDAWTQEGALKNSIMTQWYSEEKNYVNLYGQASPSLAGGDWTHFTQIVWKESTEIGCAVQLCPQNFDLYPSMYTWYTVCSYYPQGNVQPNFGANVLP